MVGIYTLLEAAREYWQSLPESAQAGFRFHHVSTDEVFGSLGDTGCFSETTAYQPNSPYAASKASSDHLVRAWHHTYGLPALITNCSNNYGPCQFPEKLIPLMILRARGRPRKASHARCRRCRRSAAACLPAGAGSSAGLSFPEHGRARTCWSSWG